jgi:hypothetical protein
MKVIFLKDHEPYKEGDKVELPPGLTQYLVSVGVAKPEKEKAEKPDDPEKEETGPPSKNEIVGKKEKLEKSTAREKHEK